MKTGVKMVRAVLVACACLFGVLGFAQENNDVLFLVNGEPVSSAEYDRFKGFVGSAVLQKLIKETDSKDQDLFLQDLENLTTDHAMLSLSAYQESGDLEASDEKINEYIDEVRAYNELVTEDSWLEFLKKNGHDQESYRQAIANDVRLLSKIEEIKKDATVSEEELTFYYRLYAKNYVTPERIALRMISVDDKKTADKILAKLKGGADFATLARQYPVPQRPNGIFRPDDAGKPTPIIRDELHPVLAGAAFALKKTGFVPVVSYKTKFYVMRVDQYWPESRKTLDQVRAILSRILREIKANRLIEEWTTMLKQTAVFSTPEGSSFSWYNPVVAKVEDQAIVLGDLNRKMYLDFWYSAGLLQGYKLLGIKAEGFEKYVFENGKSKALQWLIDEKIIQLEAERTGQPFVDPYRLEDSLRLYQMPVIQLSEDELVLFHKQNIALYTLPASAVVLSAKFPTEKAAQNFRAAFIKTRGKNMLDLAHKFGGVTTDLGRRNASHSPQKLYAQIFDLKPYTLLGQGKVSKVILYADQHHVFFMTDYKAAYVQPLDDVRNKVRAGVLEVKTKKANEAWLQNLRKSYKVESFLSAVNAEMKARALAAK